MLKGVWDLRGFSFGEGVGWCLIKSLLVWSGGTKPGSRTEFLKCNPKMSNRLETEKKKTSKKNIEQLSLPVIAYISFAFLVQECWINSLWFKTSVINILPAYVYWFFLIYPAVQKHRSTSPSFSAVFVVEMRLS